MNPTDADLTQFHIPNLGYAYNTCGVFGAATSGYRWNIAGGRLLSTLYRVMSYRCKWLRSKEFVAVAPASAISAPTNAEILAHPHDFTAFGVWGKQELMLSTFGKRLLQSKIILTDLSTSRNTDDFFHCSFSQQLMVCSMEIISFLHRRYPRFPLKAIKCFFDRIIKYDGILFDFQRQLLEIPSDKLKKSLAQVKEITLSKMASVKTVDSAKGLLCWFCKIFPLLRPFIRSANEWVVRHRDVALKKNISESAAVFAVNSALRADMFSVFSFLKSGIKSRSVFLRSLPNIFGSVQTVIHIDWAGTPTQCQAGVILETGHWYQHSPSQKQLSLLAPTDGDMSSPGLEGANLPIALATFRDQIAGKVVLVGMDNLPFIQAYYNMKTNKNHISEAVKIVALAQLYLHCFVILDFIEGSQILADPVSRNDIPSFRRSCLENEVPSIEEPLQSRFPDKKWLPPISLLF